jgi:hypothetical protein
MGIACLHSKGLGFGPRDVSCGPKFLRNMAPQLLNAVYNAGESIGPILAYTMALLMAIELGYVFVKYVVTSNK